MKSGVDRNRLKRLSALSGRFHRLPGSLRSMGRGMRAQIKAFNEARQYVSRRLAFAERD